MPSLVPSTPRICLLISVLSYPRDLLQLDLDVDAGRHIKPHQGVDGPRRGVDDVDQPLVRTHLEVLARVLVLVRRADDAVHVLLGRQRHGPGDLSAGANHRVDNLPRPAVNDLVVIGLEPDADLLSRHLASLSFARFVPLSCRSLAAASRARSGATVDRARASVCGTAPGPAWCLFDDVRDPASAHGPAALTNGEAQALLHGDRLDQLDLHLGV